MDLYTDILAKALSLYEMTISFKNLEMANSNDIVEGVCYKAIQDIIKILANDEYDDFECVEEIVTLLENIGTSGGGRHDFG